MKFTGPITARFDDQQAERVRNNFETRIAELQRVISALTSSATTQNPEVIGAGRWLGRHILNKPSGTYTSTPGTHTRLVRQIGGGGGGAGCKAVPGPDASGGSGNSGWALEYRVTGEGLEGTYVTGIGGAAGTSAPTDGGDGGDTIFTINGKQYIAKGGTGGTAGVNTNGAPKPPQGGSTQLPDVDYVWYVPPSAGSQSNTSLAYSGQSGGAAPFGSGAPASNIGPAGGGPGLGYGAGGGGGVANLFSIGGADGTRGVIVVDDFS